MGLAASVVVLGTAGCSQWRVHDEYRAIIDMQRADHPWNLTGGKGVTNSKLELTFLMDSPGFWQ